MYNYIFRVMIGNNNPFNIRYNKRNKWIGQTGCKRGFCEFDSLKHGVRAAFVLLQNYIRRDIDTPSKIINRYAPSKENPTDNYIAFVCKSEINGIGTYFKPDQEIRTYLDLFTLMSRMVWFESNVSLSSLSIMLMCGFDYDSSFNSIKLL